MLEKKTLSVSMFYILNIPLDFNVIYKRTFYLENDCFQKENY